jgi:hypothetical protein
MRAWWIVALLLVCAAATAKEAARHLVLSVAGDDPAEVDRAVMSTTQRLESMGLQAKVRRQDAQVVVDTSALDEQELGRVKQILTRPARTEFRLATDQSLLLVGQIDDVQMTLASGRVALIVTLSPRGARQLASHLQTADAHAKISVAVAGKEIIQLGRAAFESRSVQIDCGPEARSAVQRCLELGDLFRVGAVTAPLALVR